jgi:hypothetical protein
VLPVTVDLDGHLIVMFLGIEVAGLDSAADPEVKRESHDFRTAPFRVEGGRVGRAIVDDEYVEVSGEAV